MKIDGQISFIKTMYLTVVTEVTTIADLTVTVKYMTKL